MRAIILVADGYETEYVKISLDKLSTMEIFFNEIADWLPVDLCIFLRKRFKLRSYHHREVKKCPCIKNSTVSNAKILLKYLRKTLKLPKDKISFLRGSRFGSSKEALLEINRILLANREDDILFYYSGHGSYWSWFLAEKDDGKDVALNFRDLRESFLALKKNLILICDCCHALAISKYLKNIKGRYLVMGLTRASSVGYAGRTVLFGILEKWRKRRTANPSVGLIKVNARGKTLDVPQGASVSTHCIDGCTLHGDEHGFRFVSFRKPAKFFSLRRGSRLDHICYSPR
jgi:hypothetical protein